MNEKICLTRLLLIHLNREPREEAYCENFSFFHREGESARQRCLLDEYLKEDESPYFNLEEVRAICPRFILEKRDKCEISGIIKSKEIPHNNEIMALLKKFRERYNKITETTS